MSLKSKKKEKRESKFKVGDLVYINTFKVDNRILEITKIKGSFIIFNKCIWNSLETKFNSCTKTSPIGKNLINLNTKLAKLLYK